MSDRKITQIMPAAGWGAAFDTGEEEQISPLVGWALVQEPGGGTAIVGLVASEKVELCDAQDNFAGYVYLADILSDDFVLDDDFDDDDEDDDEDVGGLDEAPRDGPAFGPTGGLLN